MKFKKSISIIMIQLILILNFSFISIYSDEDTKKSGFFDNPSFCSQTNKIQDSLILSAFSLCIPGVVTKIDEFNQVECKRLYCEYQATLNGLDKSTCGKVEAYETCKLITAEISTLSEASASIRLLKNIKKLIANIAKDPLVLSQLAVQFLPSDLISRKVKITNTAIIALSGLIALKDSPPWDLPENTYINYCEKVDEIIPKLEKITKTYEQFEKISTPNEDNTQTSNSQTTSTSIGIN